MRHWAHVPHWGRCDAAVGYASDCKVLLVPLPPASSLGVGTGAAFVTLREEEQECALTTSIAPWLGLQGSRKPPEGVN